MYIVFTLPANWTIEDVAERITDIVAGRGFTARQEEGGRKWDLGGQNDVWLNVEGPGTWKLTTRCGLDPEKTGALAVVLRRWVGLRDVRIVGATE